VITSDHGLCGGFNYNIVNALNTVSDDKRKIRLLLIGRKGIIYFRNKNFNILSEYSDVKADNVRKISGEIAERVIQLYLGKEIDSVRLIFNRFRRHLLGEANISKILPLEKGKKEKLISDYLYEPEKDEVVESLISEYIKAQITSAILESRASEEMARMVAMKYATDNANELITKLMLDYHKMRQAAITKEIIEVINAAPV
jgi:F-type H+-transporting ATPase subunit gamma